MSLSSDLNMAAALVPQGKHVGQPAIALVRPATIIGAQQRSHVHLLSRSISKAHAILIRTSGGFYVRDLAARTGVFLNGTQVREHDLAHGDLIKVGNFVFRFDASGDFAAAARPPRAPEAAFEVEGNAIPFPVQDRSILIGRRQTCDVSLIESSVSTAHALLFDLDGRWFLRDLSSRTGTWLNGTKIHQQEVRFGDDIRIGETSMRFVPSTADAFRPNVDELEDLVGTAPLLEPDNDEVPTEQRLLPPAATLATTRPAPSPIVAPPQPVEPGPTPTPAPAAETGPATADADAPIPVDFDFDDPILSDPTPAADAGATGASATEPGLTPEPDAAPTPTAEAEPEIELRLAGDDDDNVAPAADDRLALDLNDTPPAPSPAVMPMPVPGSGVMAPMGVMEAEGRAGAGKEQDKSAVADLVALEPEIDLASDPDVSGPADTTALRLAPDETQRKPALSDRVVDVPENTESVEQVQHLPVDPEALSDIDVPSDRVIADRSGAARDGGEANVPDLVPAAPITESTAPPTTPPRDARRGSRRGRKDLSAPSPAEAGAAEPMAEAPRVEVPAAPPSPVAQPQEHLAGLDLSELGGASPSSTPRDDAIELAASLVPEAAPEPEPGLNLGLVHPAPDSGAGLEAPAVQPLIAPDAFETPQAEPEKPRRARRATPPKKPVTTKAPAEPKAGKPAAKQPPAPAAPVKPAAPAARRRRSTKPLAPPAVAEAVEPGAVPVEPDPIEFDSPAPVTGPVAEVIETTEPTPESALDMGEVSDVGEPLSVGNLVEPVDALSDTSFGRQLDDFTGSAPEPLIDEPPTTSAPPFDDAPSPATVSTTFEREFDAGQVSATSSELTFDVADDSVDLAPPAGPVQPMDSGDALIDPTAFTATASPTGEMGEPESERPRSPLEQIAASFTGSPLDDVDEDDAPPPTAAAPTPSMGVLEADASGVAEVALAADATETVEPPPQPIDLHEAEVELADLADAPAADVADFRPAEAAPEPMPAEAQASVLDDAPVEAPPANEIVADEAPTAPDVSTPPPARATETAPGAWRMPDESDLLLPPDSEFATGSIDGRDEASFIGGMPLPLNRPPFAQPVPAPAEPAPGVIDQDDDAPVAQDASPAPQPSAEVTQSSAASVLGTDDVARADDVVAQPVSPDLLSAAAEAAAIPQAPLPPRPRMGRRPTPFAKTPFDEIPEGPPEFEGDMVPPFTGGGGAGFGRATTAFDGLAMPPVREADVFSHQVPGHVIGEHRRARPATPGAGATDADSTLGLTPQTLEYAGDAPAANRGARPVSPGFRPPPATAPGEGSSPRPPQPRKRKWFGLKWLLPLMVLCIGLVGGTIYSAVKVVTPVQATIAFSNLEKVPESVRGAIQTAQRNQATDAEIRTQAALILAKKRAGMAPGFLAHTQEGATVRDKHLTVHFPPPGTSMVLTLASTDPSRDAIRMEALLEAMQTANQNMKDRAGQLREAERRATELRDTTRRELVDREVRLAQARQAGELRPPGEDLDAAEQRLKTLEATRTTAVLKLNDVRAALTQLQASDNPDTERLAALEREQAQAQDAVQAATKEYIDADLKVSGMHTARTQARAAYERQVELEKAIEKLKLDLADHEAAATAAVAASNAVVTAVPYKAADQIAMPRPNDPRLLYVILSSAAIMVLFAVLIALTWRAGDAGRPAIEPLPDARLASQQPDASLRQSHDGAPAEPEKVPAGV